MCGLIFMGISLCIQATESMTNKKSHCDYLEKNPEEISAYIMKSWCGTVYYYTVIK